MNIMQIKQYRRAAGPAWRDRRAAAAWLQCRGLADHEMVRRPRRGWVMLIWRPYSGRCDARSILALSRFVLATGARLHVGRGDDGPVFILVRRAGRGSTRYERVHEHL